MKRLAVGLLLVAAVAGCGGAKPHGEAPPYAYLTDVLVSSSTVRFEFRSPPLEIRKGYEPRTHLAECGSGKPIALRGAAYFIVHFQPASSAELNGEQVVFTYKGPKRLPGPGPVLEVVKMCDFEADLGWAIGLERRLPLHVARDGSAVTVSFG
jgi:hypothetical protein